MAVLKGLLSHFWWLSICVIPAPITARPGQRHSDLFVILGFAPAMALLGGTMALLYPQTAARWPWLVHVGAFLTVLFLLTAPFAFRISMQTFESKPVWLVTTTIGTAMGVAYLVAYMLRCVVGTWPPNKSLERTRGR
jgi:hypothetical protein